MGQQQKNVKAIFDEAAEFPSPERRTTYLDKVCAGNPELRQKVQGLLDAHDRAGSFLVAPLAATVAYEAVQEKLGTQIGPYKLREQIGEGGMGVVYLAEQAKPIRRKVALKIIKPGMDTKDVIARFEAERQALALMDHPNISKVIDAGATDSGRPYFVMELVNGIPITEYCDQAKLSTQQRLGLFIKVCRAIQHAHQKGIIHREIKPSNVLITMMEDGPEPKVIDFGVAKAINQQLTEQTLYTAHAQVVGTPLYMSPEQAERTGFDIDTRSDVYSLGVLLYELLTGNTPFDKDTMKQAGFDEMRRIIREDEPPRPSARVSTLKAEQLSTISDQRGVDPRKYSHALSGELDWIVMRALEKDRTRRYESASAFAADIERYLKDEPVEACPPSTSYRLRKYARRNKAALITTALVVASLLVGTGVSIWQAIEAEDARQTAENSEKVADRRLVRANAEYDRAESEKQAAIRERDTANHNLYFAHMRQAQQDWESGRVSRVLSLLSNFLPHENRPDVRDWEWYYFQSLCHRELLTLLPRQGIWAEWSPNGEYIACAGDDGIISIWDPESGDQVRAITGHNGRVRRVSWNPDNTRIASAGSDGSVRIWNAQTGKELHRLAESANSELAWSPDGTRLALGGWEAPVTIWNAESGKLVRSLKVEKDLIFRFAWSPDGTRLATAGEGSVRIWEVATGQVSASWEGHDTFCLAWSPDGTRLAGGRFDGHIYVWETQTWNVIQDLIDRSSVGSIAWSPDGRFLATGTRADSITVWNTLTWKQVVVLRGHTNWIKAVTWSSDGKRLVSASHDSTVKIWDVTRDQETVSFQANRTPWLKISWNRNGDRLASGDWPNKLIQIWNTNSGQLVEELLPKGKPHVWSQDDRHLVSITGNSATTESSIRHRIRRVGHDLSPDGRFYIKRTSGSKLNILNVLTGKRHLSIETKTLGGAGLRVIWSPGADQLATSLDDGVVRIWDTMSGKLIHELHGHARDHWITALAWSHNGRQLASAGWDQVIKVWDVASGTEVYSLRGHTGLILTLAWNHSGTRLISSGFQNRIRLWDTVRRKEILVLAQLPNAITQLAWSADDKRIAAAFKGGTIMIWDASWGLERQSAGIEATDK